MESIDLSRQNLILKLIISDMRNQKLISGLNQAGVLVDDFYTDLATEILKLVGFANSERDDDLYEFYDNTMDQLIDLEVNEFIERQQSLALEFYNCLLEVRSKNSIL